jgi:hypothetical protein
VEQTHTAAVSIDKTIEGATFAADITEPTNQNVTLTIGYPADALLNEYKAGDSGEWTAYTAPVVVTANGTVYARSTDAAGNVSLTSYTVSNIDKTPPADPTLSADITAPTNQSVTVTMSYSDDATVKEYKVGDSGGWTVYTSPVVVTENDSVYARGTDAAGNVSNVISYAISNIDKIAPVTVAALNPETPNGSNGWYTSDVTVTLSVNDNSSRMSLTQYQVNDGPWMDYTGSMPAFGNGVYTVKFYSTDQVGNVEQIKAVEFKVDKTAPELYIELDKTEIWPGNHKMVQVHAVLNSFDEQSGVESVVLTSITCDQQDDCSADIEAEFGTAATSFSLRAEQSRIYTITYTVTDYAGNKTDVSVIVTVPHDQA